MKSRDSQEKPERNKEHLWESNKVLLPINKFPKVEIAIEVVKIMIIFDMDNKKETRPRIKDFNTLKTIKCLKIRLRMDRSLILNIKKAKVKFPPLKMALKTKFLKLISKLWRSKRL